MQNDHPAQSFLSEVPPGEKATIITLYGGKEINRRLTSLGFTPGAGIKIVQNFGHGPMIVNIRDTRIALGRGEAAKICVQRGEK